MNTSVVMKVMGNFTEVKYKSNEVAVLTIEYGGGFSFTLKRSKMQSHHISDSQEVLEITVVGGVNHYFDTAGIDYMGVNVRPFTG